MENASYDEKNDILYISFSDEPHVEKVNTKALILFIDKNGDLCRIGIKHAKSKGVIDELVDVLYTIRS